MGAFVALTIVLILFSFSSAQQCPYSETGLQSFNTLYPSVTSADNIVISTKVLLDVSTVTARWINITKGGQLIFKDMAINLKARLIFVGDGGALRIGSAACPLKSNIVITLTGAYSNQSNMIDEVDRILMGTKGIGVSSGGSIDVHGVSPQPTWTRLSKHAEQNSSIISLQQSVDWKVGSAIVIASTDFPGVYLGGSSTSDPASFIPYTPNQWAPQPLPPNQNEERMIVSISNDRRTITLDSPLNFTHYGLDDIFYMSAEVGLLSRNIKIQGDDESETEFFGGHIMIRNVVAARFTAVELYHMGQKGVVGRYPIHFHLMGSGIDPVNRYIKDSSVHDVYQRCIVIHTSHGVMILFDFYLHVAYKTNGHCYFLEDGPETYNTFDGNLGILALPIYASDPDGVSRRIIVADAAPSIFWIVNPNNTVTNNVAVEAQNGFWYALPDAPVGISVDCCPGLVPKNIPLLSFKDNVAHSTGSGLFVDKGIMHSTPAGMVNAKTNYAPTVPAYFDGLIAYKNRDFGIWTQSENVHVINAKLYDNKVAARMIAGRNSLQNAIVVAETDNLGVPAASNRIRSRPLRYDSELVGWMFYDHGSQSIRNVSFIGFNTTKERSANAINFPCQPHPHNSFMRLENVRYSNSISFRIPNITTCYLTYDNLKAVNVMDTDGSTTGWVGGWIVSNLDIHKYAGCVPMPEWLDGAKCPPTFEGYVRTAINVVLANVPPSDNSSLPTLMQIVPLEQPGSAALDLAGDETMDANRVVTGYNFATNLKNTRTYLVRWLSKYVSTRVNLRMGEYGQPGEWVILVFPYPKSAALSFVGSYTSVNSINELVSSTYFYDSSKELLYVRLTIEEENNNGRPRGNWANWAHYSTGSGITLSIIANCSSSSSSEFCRAPASNAPGFSVSIPPRREQAFRADLTTCGSSQSVSYRDDIELSGTAFLSYDPKTARLSYHIVHNIGLNVTKMLVQCQQNPGLPATVELELPALPVAPIKGFTYLSKTSHQRLVAGKLRIVFTTDAAPNGVLFGYFGCVGTCSLPEKAVNVSTCAPVTNTTVVDIYSNGNFAKLQQAWAGNNAYVIAPTNDSVEGVCGGSKPIKAFISNGYLNIGANTVVPNLESKFKFLEFWIKADIPNSGQPDLFVLLRNATQIGNKVKIEKSHLLGHAITSDWTRVRIPLSDFDVTSSIAFRYLQFSQVFPNNARPIYYFDQIRFTSIGDSAPIQDPSAPTTVALYSSNLCSVTVTEDGSSTTSTTSTTSPSFDQSSASLVFVAAHLIVIGLLATLF